MSRLTQDSVRRIVEQVDIVDLISKYVSLKLKGSEASGLCPFHNEKSPSFTVSRTKQFFYCFGCHAKGNAIDFVMQQQKYSFPEAMTYLGELYSITLDHEEQQAAPSLDYPQLYKLMLEASKLYEEQLRASQEVIDYCKNRQLSGLTAKRFSLGYAPENTCLSKLHAKNPSLIQASGLWSTPSSRERFKNRLIFPIANVQGKIIGFGGRALKDEQQPKYLNSPDTPLFHKSKVLYGMHQALKKPLDHWIVVEGYMDVLLCHQYGITQAVAALGTAFTLDHFKLLTRYSNKITFCFDGDAAGLRALHRSMKALLPSVTDQHDIRCVYLPENQDPDTYLRTHGIENWNNLLNKAQRWEDYWQQQWAHELQLDLLSDKAKYLQRAQACFDEMPNSYLKQLWLSKLQQQTDAKITLNKPAKIPEKILTLTAQAPITDLIRWLIASPESADKFKATFDNFPADHPLIYTLLAWVSQRTDEHQAFWIESMRDSALSELIAQAQSPSNNPLIPLDDCMKWLKKHALESAIQALLELESRSTDENMQLKSYLELKHQL